MKREEEWRSRRRSTQEEEEEMPVDVRCDSIAIRRSYSIVEAIVHRPRQNKDVAMINFAVNLSIEDRTGANYLPDRSVPPGLFYDRATCGFAGQFLIRVVL